MLVQLCALQLALVIPFLVSRPFALPNQKGAQTESPPVAAESRNVRDALIGICRELRQDMPSLSFRRIEDADELLAVSSWRCPDDWFLMTGQFDDDKNQPIFALPRVALGSVSQLKYGILFRCRDFVVLYETFSLGLREYLDEVLEKTAAESHLPDSVRAAVSKRLREQPELAWRRTGLEFLTSEPDYNQATIEELYTDAVCTKVFARSLGVYPSFIEVARQNRTVLVEHLESSISASKWVCYSLFVNGDFVYRVYVFKNKETEQFKHTEGWETVWTDVQRSILAYGLGMAGAPRSP